MLKCAELQSWYFENTQLLFSHNFELTVYPMLCLVNHINCLRRLSCVCIYICDKTKLSHIDNDFTHWNPWPHFIILCMRTDCFMQTGISGETSSQKNPQNGIILNLCKSDDEMKLFSRSLWFVVIWLKRHKHTANEPINKLLGEGVCLLPPIDSIGDGKNSSNFDYIIRIRSIFTDDLFVPRWVRRETERKCYGTQRKR